MVWILALVNGGCNTCGEDFVAEKASPDGKFVAVIYTRGCGAASPFVTHVNLRAANERFSPSWDGGVRKAEMLSIKNIEPIEIVWVDGGIQLHVKTSAIIKCADSVAGLKVSCLPPKAS